MISSVPLIFLYDVTDVVGKAVGKVRILGRFQIGDVEMAKVSPSLVERNLCPNSFCGCESIKPGNSASIQHLETQQIANTDRQNQGWQSVNHFRELTDRCAGILCHQLGLQISQNRLCPVKSRSMREVANSGPVYPRLEMKSRKCNRKSIYQSSAVRFLLHFALRCNRNQ